MKGDPGSRVRTLIGWGVVFLAAEITDSLTFHTCILLEKQECPPGLPMLKTLNLKVRANPFLLQINSGETFDDLSFCIVLFLFSR